MNKKMLLLLLCLLPSCSTRVVEMSLSASDKVPQGARVVIIDHKKTKQTTTITNGVSTNKKILYNIKLKADSEVLLKFDKESRHYLHAIYIAPNGKMEHGIVFRPCDTLVLCASMSMYQKGGVLTGVGINKRRPYAFGGYEINNIIRLKDKGYWYSKWYNWYW